MMANVEVILEENFCVVSSYDEDIHHFTKKVQELIKSGWKVNGGISSSNSKIFQALIKK